MHGDLSYHGGGGDTSSCPPSPPNHNPYDPVTDDLFIGGGNGGGGLDPFLGGCDANICPELLRAVEGVKYIADVTRREQESNKVYKKNIFIMYDPTN